MISCLILIFPIQHHDSVECAIALTHFFSTPSHGHPPRVVKKKKKFSIKIYARLWSVVDAIIIIIQYYDTSLSLRTRCVIFFAEQCVRTEI